MITYGHVLRIAPEREVAALACADAAAQVAPSERRDSRRVGGWLLAQVLLRDGHACVWCGEQYGLVADHHFPHVQGGRTVLGNLQTLCQGCNRFKWMRPVELERIDGGLYVRTLPCGPKVPW